MNKKVFKPTVSYTKSFIYPLFQKLIKDYKLKVYGMEKNLPNIKDSINKDNFLGIMMSSGFMPSNEDKKNLFPHIVSLELISNSWNILKLFNRTTNVPNSYEIFTKSFYNNNYIGIRNIPLNYNFNTIIKVIDEYIKEFYCNNIDSLIFKDEFLQSNKKTKYNIYKLIEKDSLPEYIRELESYPYYSIRYKINITDIVNSNNINIIETESYIIEKDSNNNYYTTVTILVFPFNKKVSILTFDSDTLVLFNSKSYSNINDVDSLIKSFCKESIENYFKKIQELNIEREETESFINNSMLSKSMKGYIIKTINNVDPKINKSINLANCNTITDQTLYIIFGNMFNNLVYEYITDNNKYMVKFNEYGEDIRLIDKPSDILLLRNSFLASSDNEENKNFLQNNINKDAIKKIVPNIISNGYSIKLKSKVLLKIEHLLNNKMKKFMNNNLEEQKYSSCLPLFSYNLVFYQTGMKINLSLYYDLEFEDHIYHDFIGSNLVSYNIYNNKVKVKSLTNKTRINLDSFENNMKERSTTKKLIKMSSKKFQECIAYPFIDDFINTFSNISDIRKSLCSISKEYINIVEKDKDILNAVKERKKTFSYFNMYKHGCEVINNIDRICNNIRYSKCKSLNEFLIETKYYIDWKYVLKEIDVA